MPGRGTPPCPTHDKEYKGQNPRSARVEEFIHAGSWATQPQMRLLADAGIGDRSVPRSYECSDVELHQDAHVSISTEALDGSRREERAWAFCLFCFPVQGTENPRVFILARRGTPVRSPHNTLVAASCLHTLQKITALALLRFPSYKSHEWTKTKTNKTFNASSHRRRVPSSNL